MQTGFLLFVFLFMSYELVSYVIAVLVTTHYDVVVSGAAIIAGVFTLHYHYHYHYYCYNHLFIVAIVM